MVKIVAKETAKQLRHEGYSYNLIAPRVGVSKSTLSVWLADIQYSPNAETLARIGKARATSGEVKSKLKRESLALAYNVARRDIGIKSKRDLFMVGLGLYMGEGTKSIQETRFVNANPKMILFMVKWFTQSLKIPKENLRVRLHLYPDSEKEACIRYWSKILNLPEKQFMKSMIDHRIDKKRKKVGKLPYGTAHLKVNSLGNKSFGVFLARKLMSCMDIIFESTRV